MKQGFLKTKFGAVTNTLSDTGPPVYMVHHPSQLFYLFIGINFKLFGVSALSLKIIPFLFSLGNLILIYLIAKKISNEAVAMIASFIFAVIPMASVYGPLPDIQGSVPLFFILLTFFFYIQSSKSQNRKFYWLMVIAFLLGTQTAWPTYLIIPAIMLHSIITEKRIRKETVILPFFAVAALLLYLTYVNYLTGNFVGTGSYQGSLIGAYEIRTSSIASDFDHSLTFTIPEFIVKLGGFYNLLFTPIILVLSGVWCSLHLGKLYYRKGTEQDLYLFVLFLPAIAYILLFKQGAWIHDFWSFYLLPGLVISSALIIYEISLRFPKKISVPLLFMLTLQFLMDSVFGFAVRQNGAYGTHLDILQLLSFKERLFF